MKHEQNAELFASLETAKFQLADLRNRPEEDAGAVRYWEKEHAAIVNQLLTLNKGLVVSIAAKLKHLDHENELEQVGDIAMSKAIARFNPERGVTFSTYAHRVIRGSMLRAINKNRTIGIPEEKIGQLLDLKKTLEKLRAADENRDEAEPSADDLAWAMNLPVARIRELLALQTEVISLDGCWNETSDCSGHDVIADTKTVAPQEEAELNDDMKFLWQAVNALSGRDADVFLHGGGFFGREKQSFEKIGIRHGFSRQRAQQVFDNARRAVAAFIRSKKAQCSGRIAQQRLGFDKKNTPAAVANVAVPAPVSVKPYRLKTRAVDKTNPNHHIWLNNGTWYCKFVLELANGKTSTICNSLNTKDVMVARKMRDNLILLYNAPAWLEAA